MHRITVKGVTAILTVLLTSGLAACQMDSSGQDWYLLATDSKNSDAVSVSPFGKDHAKCNEFAVKFPKQVESRCVSGQEIEKLRLARHWRCALGVCASVAINKEKGSND
jgi:hypothetical protein